MDTLDVMATVESGEWVSKDGNYRVVKQDRSQGMFWLIVPAKKNVTIPVHLGGFFTTKKDALKALCEYEGRTGSAPAVQDKVR